MACIFRHRWGKWKVIPVTREDGKSISVQRRYCERCDKVEIETLWV